MGKTVQAKKENSNLIKGYLFGYNAIQAIGWSYLLFQIFTYYDSDYSKSNPTANLFDYAYWTVVIFQNAAILEVFHAQMGIVPSNPAITAFQVASRVMLVCGVWMLTDASRHGWGIQMALFAWSITEVIRYSNYALNLINCVPYAIKWLRYTTFYVLYPIGVTGELLCLYAASEEIGMTGEYTYNMPNKYNVIFNYRHFLWFVMFLYIPMFPQMYMHMIVQRKKVLGRVEAKKTN